MSIHINLGGRVRDLRKRAGLTQAELANRCGIKVEYQRIGELERGESNPTLATIQCLADALGIEPAELFLFHPRHVEKSMSVLDDRLVDMWRSASDEQKQKIIRVVAEIL